MAKTKYVKIGGAFFHETPEGLKAIASPKVLRKLYKGLLPYETRKITRAKFATTITAPEVKPQPKPKIPETTETPDTDKAIKSAKGTTIPITGTSKEILEFLAQRELERQKDWRKKVENWLTQLSKKIFKEKQRTALEEWEEQLKKYKVPETFEQIQALTKDIEPLRQQLIELEKEEQERLLQAEQRMAPMTFIRGEKALIQRQYAIQKATLAAQIQAKAAQIQALSGNIAIARQLANQAVRAMTYDQEFEYNRLRDFIRLNQSFLESLSEERRQTINLLLREKERELEEKRREREQIMKWATDPETAGAFVGVDLTTIDYEEAAELVKEYLRTKPKEEKEYAPTQYKREWLEAGGLEGTGMTLSEWIKRRTGIEEEIPYEWTDEEIRGTVRNWQAAGASYQEVLREIALEPTLLNKDRARQIAAEMYGIKEEVKPEEILKGRKETTLWEELFGTKKPSKEEMEEVLKKKKLPLLTSGTLTGTLPESTIPLFE